MTHTNESKNTESANTNDEATTGCCGGPAPSGTSGCCALDAEVKATGGSGCGCGTRAETAAPAKKGCC